MPGPKVYTLDEVNALVPRLAKTFERVDAIRAELRVLHIRVQALELIWGTKLRDEDNPDHGELVHHVAEMKRLEDEVEELTHAIVHVSGVVKSLDPPLVDFIGVREGRLIHWCWTRGEERIAHWHHTDAGFAGRQPV